MESTKDHIKKMLGEYSDLPFHSPNLEQVRDAVDDKPSANQLFDWPDNPIKQIKHVISMPCSTPTDPDFVFKLTGKAATHNHQLFDWPDNLIERIKHVISTPCSTPTAPDFVFELTDKAATHNLAILAKHGYDLG